MFLAVTRTLTILYSTTLLALFTNIQLTLLARSKYVHSILQQERDERLRERLEYGASVWGGVGNLLDLENMVGGDDDEEEEISEQIEIKYLTLSWWILHVGWKDIAERVRRGVEEVFEGVSLKTNLGTIELHRLVSDVRRRVEYEVTFEGNERRIK
jgi:peroxin-3